MIRFKVEKFKSEYAQTLYEIESLCFTSCWSLNQFLMIPQLEYAHFFVVLSNDKIVGFAGIYTIDDAELMNIAVLPDYRRKGAGMLLLNTCIKCAKNNLCKNMYLEVRKSNTNAIDLYEKIGFKQISIRKNYYKQPIEDAIIMCKGL